MVKVTVSSLTSIPRKGRCRPYPGLCPKLERKGKVSWVGAAVKSTYCSSKEPKFGVWFPGHTSGGSQPPVTPAPGNPVTSSGLHGHLHSQVHTHTPYTIKNKSIKNSISELPPGKKKSLGPAAIKQNHFTVKHGRLPGNQLELQTATSALKGSTSSLPPVPWHLPPRKCILMRRKEEVTLETT